MNFIPLGTTIVQAAALNLLPLFYVRPRSIAGLVANATIEERQVDELQITRHPVENGASITDHAFKQPASCTIQAGWSNSSPEALGNSNYIIAIYDALLRIQRSREPFDVITGKRFYTNMLMKRLFVVTDERSENALMVTCECEEIIIVSTQTVTVPKPADMKNPQSNAATTNAGAKQLVPGNSFNALTPVI